MKESINQQENDAVLPRRSREEPTKAKLPYRIIAWVSVIALCFAVGYGTTSLVLRYLDKRGVTTEKDVVASGSDAARLLAESGAGSGGSVQRVAIRLFVPEGEAFKVQALEVVPGVFEDDAKRALGELFARLKSQSALKEDVQVLHLFRSGETAFLDVNDSFVASLEAVGPEKALLLVTGIVRTLTENFSPLTRVRFLVNGREAMETTPIDLTVAWALGTNP
ncbi:GerMN domain-containing protein [Aminithiophilus ramosus]|uniref:GerMN domain-containing protein n=1 Tax=Aminithiophilus ramosus TaxID=3029084 RepID=A0A9Q7ANS8_9BACT|nr:GerMN domain-containing protein [Aminithiophilus ramosus]QTX32842.1 GerMN domain-containing protein [Aminithiophilus ramosus]